MTTILVAGGLAQAQTGDTRHDTAETARDFERVPPVSRWGRGLELSEGGLAQAKKPTKREGFIVIRDASRSPAPGKAATADHRMSLGYRGIWSSDFVLAARKPTLSASSEDDELISFYTLRYDGMQLGISYFPGMDHRADPSPDMVAQPSSSAIALGANYDRRFDDFGVGVSAALTSADTFADVAIPDTDAWTVGARFDVGGLRVSGGLQLGGNAGDNARLLAASGWDEAWNLGARYRWGRNDVTLAYEYGENRADRKAPGDDKLDAATLSYVRELDRGVKWSVNFLWADHDGNATGGTTDYDGTALSTAIRLSF